MVWIVILLFVVGSMFGLASYGSGEKKKKWIYGLIAGGIWMTLLILANTLL